MNKKTTTTEENKKIKFFLSKIYHFTAVKNRCILLGYVFVMNYNHAYTPMNLNSNCYNILSSIKVYREMPH